MRELHKKIYELGNLFDKHQNEDHSERNTELISFIPFKSLGYHTGDPELVSSQYLAVPEDPKTGKVDLALLQNGNFIDYFSANLNRR